MHGKTSVYFFSLSTLPAFRTGDGTCSHGFAEVIYCHVHSQEWEWEWVRIVCTVSLYFYICLTEKKSGCPKWSQKRLDCRLHRDGNWNQNKTRLNVLTVLQGADVMSNVVTCMIYISMMEILKSVGQWKHALSTWVVNHSQYLLWLNRQAFIEHCTVKVFSYWRYVRK